VQVERAVARDQHVPRRTCLDRPVAEQLAELRDVDLHATQAARGLVVAPHLFEQGVGGDDGVRAQKESGEERALAHSSERNWVTLLDHLQRPQDPEFHACGRT